MMRKLILMTIIALSAASLVAFASEMPENITLDACADTKAAVEFPHTAHFELAACVDCHHTSEGLTAETVADMEVASCASCHLDPEEATTPSCKEKSLKKNPFHVLCVSCHKDAKKENADTKAPTKCNDCHPKPAG
jgi:hypothetical protein